MRRILLWQCLLYTASALPCGLLVGIAAGSCLITVGTAITGAQIRLSITGTGVLLSLLTGLAVIFQIIFQITSSVSSYQYALDFEADYKMMGVNLTESERNNTMLREEFGLTEAELTSFYRGEFICPFLPELYVAENPSETMAQIYEGYFADPVPLIRSSSLQKGDAVRLFYVTVKRDNQGQVEEVLRESREYKINAIADIYSFFASHRENVSTSTYGIVMSGILLEDFSTYPDGSRYQTIWLKTNDDATYESTDKMVSALAAKEKTNYFVNTRLLQQERFAKMLSDVSGLLFVMILLTLLLVLILYHLFTLRQNI